MIPYPLFEAMLHFTQDERYTMLSVIKQVYHEGATLVSYWTNSSVYSLVVSKISQKLILTIRFISNLIEEVDSSNNRVKNAKNLIILTNL